MANKQPTTKPPKISKLVAENSKLKKQNLELAKKLKRTSPTKPIKSKRLGSWRTALVILAAGAAGALLLVGNLLFWVGNTLVNTPRFVAVTSPLIKQPAIQSAVANYTTQQLFDNVNVQGAITQVLPPRAAFLAPTLASQLKTKLNSQIKSLLQNPSVQQYWTQALTRGHQSIISLATSYKGNGDINLNDFYNALSKKLESTNLSFLANKTLPPKIGTITVVKAPWLPKLHRVVTKIGWWQAITTGLFLVLSFVATWFAKNRRKMAMVLGLMYSALMLVSIIGIRLSEHVLISDVSPTYQSAASEAAKVVLRPFIIQSATILLLGLLVFLVVWLSGSSRPATSIKQRFGELLSGKLHTAVFGKKENRFTKWVGLHKRAISWIYVAIIALIMLLVTLNPKLVLVYAILVLLGVVVIEFLAAKKPS